MYDKVGIRVRGGKGGDGAISFRREKYVPFGGPDGGDGGDGGDVAVVADPSVSDLREFRQNRLYKAEDGDIGRGKRQNGKKGKSLILKVPEGMVAWKKDREVGEGLIADCERSGQRAVLARGGKGGFGNTHFTSSTNQAPVLAQKGEDGEEFLVVLELRLIADVGIIGYPNVGKSTLLASATAAKPKIAEYSFTTLEPVLGVVEVGQEPFVLAEIPGLIDGAHLGRGLGYEFLRHIVRTRVIVHLVDATSVVSPVEDMVRVNRELSLYDAKLAEKPQIVAVNKIDLIGDEARLAEIMDSFRSVGTSVLFVSAASGEGVAELMAETKKMLSQVAAEVKTGEQMPKMVFHPEPKAISVSVHKEGDVFVVVAPELERIVARVDVNNPEVRWQFYRQLTRAGGTQALEKAGIKSGDKVRCGNSEWEW